MILPKTQINVPSQMTTRKGSSWKHLLGFLLHKWCIVREERKRVSQGVSQQISWVCT